MPQENREVKVVVVGAGLAGLTAALRLCQRGYNVTLYEEKSFLGGNFGAQEYHGIAYEVFCHMFGNWYNNFWHLIEEDLGLKKEDHFTPRTNLKLLRKGEFPRFTQLTNSGSFTDQLGNLWSGIEPVADMFLWSYSLIDLLSQRFHMDQLLSRYSVNGFMYSRPYATNRSAALHEDILMTVWSVHSDQTSAVAYKRFIQYAFRHPEPPLWLLQGNVFDEIITPLQVQLQKLSCEIKTNVSVTKVILNQGKVESIRLQQEGVPESDQQVEHLILAVPPKTLGKLVITGKPHERIVDRIPKLAELRRLHAEPIPVLTVYFKRKLPNIPKEPVALRDSRYDLSFIDISQSWVNDPRMKEITALCMGASDFYALPSLNDKEDAFDMLEELNGYLPFHLGESWGDSRSDIDWDKSHFQPNTDNELFINEVGSEEWRPEATYASIPNLFFAGDCCKTTINIATVESAVMSGLNAAQAVWRKAPLGQPIEIIEPDVYPESVILVLKLLLAPYASGAKWWSMAYDTVSQLVKGELPQGFSSNLLDTVSSSYALASDWWKTLGSLYKGCSRTPTANEDGERQKTTVQVDDIVDFLVQASLVSMKSSVHFWQRGTGVFATHMLELLRTLQAMNADPARREEAQGILIDTLRAYFREMAELPGHESRRFLAELEKIDRKIWATLPDGPEDPPQRRWQVKS